MDGLQRAAAKNQRRLTKIQRLVRHIQMLHAAVKKRLLPHLRDLGADIDRPQTRVCKSQFSDRRHIFRHHQRAVLFPEISLVIWITKVRMSKCAIANGRNPAVQLNPVQ